jgi:hypothetical protein
MKIKVYLKKAKPQVINVEDDWLTQPYNSQSAFLDNIFPETPWVQWMVMPETFGLIGSLEEACLLSRLR